MFAGLLNSIGDAFTRRVFAVSLENPQFDLNDPRIWEAMGHTETDAGIHVSPEIALTLAPVWQSVSIISGDIASATAHVFKRMGEGDREVDSSHEADYLISEQPNEEMSAFELWRRFGIHLLLWQNGYLYLDRAGRIGKVRGMYNLLPDRTCPMRDDRGNLYYTTEVDGNVEILLKEEVLHVRGLSIDTGPACELVAKARESWALSIAAERFSSKFFKNGAQTGGIFEVPPQMTEKAQRNFEKSIQDKHTGRDNWFKVMVLRDGAKFHATTIDAQKSQMTELRESQVRDTARFFNLPPGKLGLEDSVSYNSAEQTQIQYITGCLTHWFSAIRAESQLKLLSEQQRRNRTHFIDFNTSKLIERDLKTTVDILAIERQNEIINAAEWRRKRDLPPRTDEAAFEYVNPNTKSNPQSPAEPEEDDTTEDSALEEPIKALLRNAVNRTARRVGIAARKSAKSVSQFAAFVESKAADQHKGFDEVLLPIATVVAALVGGDGSSISGLIRVRFFTVLTDYLAPILELPVAELESNTNDACLRFESEVADAIEQVAFAQKKELVPCP